MASTWTFPTLHHGSLPWACLQTVLKVGLGLSFAAQSNSFFVVLPTLLCDVFFAWSGAETSDYHSRTWLACMAGFFRNRLPTVNKFLTNFHGSKVRVYNLCSERAYDASKLGGNVACFPFDDHQVGITFSRCFWCL